jgi:hypothetical protein
LQLGKRRVREPAGARELTHHQRDVHQQRAGGGEPEAGRIQRREGDVAYAELQWDDEVHQSYHERHRHEEDHDRAVGGENLIVVLGRQIAWVPARGHCELRAHHQRIDESAQQQHQSQQHIHDSDALMVDAGQPLPPQIGPGALPGGQHQDDEDADDNQH